MLNGAFDSADAASDIIMSEILIRRRNEIGSPNREPAIVVEALAQLCPISVLDGIFKITWALDRSARILHIGSGHGAMVASLRSLGYDAIGVECHKRPAAIDAEDFNVHCEFDDLPFKDRSFDVVIESGLCRLPPNRISKAIDEIRRVTRHGLVLCSIATDLPVDLIERHQLLDSVETLGSRWDWSEKLCGAGFGHALMDPALLNAAWSIAEAAGAGPGHWFEDSESLMFCIYQLKRKAVQPELPSLTSHDNVSVAAE